MVTAIWVKQKMVLAWLLPLADIVFLGKNFRCGKGVICPWFFGRVNYSSLRVAQLMLFGDIAGVV